MDQFGNPISTSAFAINADLSRRNMPAQDAVYFGYGGELRSGFGKQVLAPQETAPNVGFGSSARASSQHIYASAEHDRAKVKSAGGNQSQGAIYQVPVCCSLKSS